MEDLVERLARGKLIAVGYGKLRPAFLGAGPASQAHRASGDTIRWWHAAGRFPPVLGISVFLLLAATWASTAGAFLS